MKLIKHLLSQPQSKKIRDEIVTLILSDNQNMDILMELFFSKDNRMCQKASWPMTVLGEKKPDLIIPYVGRMLGVIDNPVHNSVVRNVIRVFQAIDLPEEYEGIVFEKCFNYLNNTKEDIAVRVFSMTVLSNIAMIYPDLKEEVIISIQQYYPSGSPAYKSRAKKELTRLKK